MTDWCYSTTKWYYFGVSPTPSELERKLAIKVPECQCFLRPEFADPTQPLHVDGCRRLKALRKKWG